MKKVMVGISGGVDSSVSAYLLKQQGYDVEGVHFCLKKGVGDVADARAVCDWLGIKLHEVDFSAVFNEKVFAPFISEYESGLTPNICVMCNRYIKFGALFEYAKSCGADYIATGHYCSTQVVGERCYLACAKDSQKDQTYFLNQVNEQALKRTLFPLATYTKEQVRSIAEQNGLITAHKKGSSDICLMGDLTFRQFLAPYLKEKKGQIISDTGDIVGQHSGLFNYTLGQRKGLGLGGKSGESGRWFVVKKDVVANALYVSHGDESKLFTQTITIKNCNWIGRTPCNGERLGVKTRYAQDLVFANIRILSDCVEVNFEHPQRAVTPGQYCVFYDDGICLGGGKII